VAETAPLPVRWILHQSALYGIPVQVSQLYVELALIADVPVVLAFLPERRRGADPSAQPFREGEFEEVHGVGEGGLGEPS